MNTKNLVNHILRTKNPTSSGKKTSAKKSLGIRTSRSEGIKEDWRHRSREFNYRSGKGKITSEEVLLLTCCGMTVNRAAKLLDVCYSSFRYRLDALHLPPIHGVGRGNPRRENFGFFAERVSELKRRKMIDPSFLDACQAIFARYAGGEDPGKLLREHKSIIKL